MSNFLLDNLSTVFGVAGILASIIVGYITYSLTKPRLESTRYTTAKTRIIHDLSQALGEDNVPSRKVIGSTIRSVVEEMRYTGLVQIEVQDVLDDLLRNILSDPFLEANRRKKLLSDLESVAEEAAHAGEEAEDEETYGDVVPTLLASLTAVVTVAGMGYFGVFSATGLTSVANTSTLAFGAVALAIATYIFFVLRRAR